MRVLGPPTNNVFPAIISFSVQKLDVTGAGLATDKICQMLTLSCAPGIRANLTTELESIFSSKL
jgi:hypothetical protein